MLRNFFSRYRRFLAFTGIILVILAAFEVFGVSHFVTLDIKGPDTASVITPPSPTSFTQYGNCQPSDLAILLTDEKSSWLGLAHALKTIGVPFCITKDSSEAITHSMVMVYPLISGKVMSDKDLQRLTGFTADGGTLIGINVLGGGMNTLFGFKEAIPSRTRFTVHFSSERSPLLAAFTDPLEQTISLGNREKVKETVGTYSYSQPRYAPLATYASSEAAITESVYGKGRTFAFGMDIGDLFFRGHHDRSFDAERSYVNAYEPSLDVLMRLLKNLYRTYNPYAVTLGTVPDGKKLSVIFSHDIDYSKVLDNALVYAENELKDNVHATYFIQTKYIRDYNDEVFFTRHGIDDLKKLVGMGMELGSHTVSHSRGFSSFPIGTGAEAYPTYKPFVLSREKAVNASVLGELRVSKFLVENTGNTSVISFRPGYLSYPTPLPQALVATGYRFSSSMTANNALTHLPFQLNYNREIYQEVPVFEFPVTLEDEKLPLMGERVESAVQLANKLATYGGLCVILSHPNILDHKLYFAQTFRQKVKDFSWFGRLEDFGNWWSARNNIRTASSCEGKQCSIHVSAPDSISSLTLEVPTNWRYMRSSDNTMKAVQTGNNLLVSSTIQGDVTLYLRDRN